MDPSGRSCEQAVMIGGDFEVSVEGNLDVDAAGEDDFASGIADLSNAAFRRRPPERDFRVLADGDLGYSTARGGRSR